MLVIQIDGINSQPLQRSFRDSADVFGATVQGAPLPAVFRIGFPSELGRDDNLATVGLERLAHKLFIDERTVDLGSVEERYPTIHASVQQPDHLRLIFR